MGRVMMAARMLFTCTVERSGSWGAVHLPCGQQWWLEKCCMHALWRKEVTPRIVYSCTVEVSLGCQDAICTHYGEECLAARVLCVCIVDRSGSC